MSGAPANALRRNGVSIAPGATAFTRTPTGRPLDGELARELHDRPLARRVGRLVAESDDAGDGREVDDGAAAALGKFRQRLAAMHEHAAHVRAHHGVPLLVRRVDRRLEQEAGGVVDEDVEPSELRERRVDGRPGRAALGDVADHCHHSPLLFELGDRRIDVLRDDERAGGEELVHDVPADAACSARHDRDRPRELGALAAHRAARSLRRRPVASASTDRPSGSCSGSPTTTTP